jgi:hypothetical protein
MVFAVMARKPNPPPSAPVALRRRGRSPKPGGRIPQAEVQRAYRARLAAAGKVVRIVDAGAINPAAPRVAVASDPAFDPARDGVYERAMIENMRDDLHNALLRIELLEDDRNRWKTDCARAEGRVTG